MENKMKIVFLDIDGVLVNRKSLMQHSGKQAVGDADCVGQLNRIVRETGAKIVVSSTWRLGINGLKDCRKHLKYWGVNGEVIARTEDLTRRPEDDKIWVNVERGEEIAEFLSRHPEIESFVILDDDSDMAHLGHRLVKTKFEPGLTKEDADLAIAMLGISE